MDNSLLILTLLKTIRWYNKTTTICKYYITNQFVLPHILVPSRMSAACHNKIEVSTDLFKNTYWKTSKWICAFLHYSAFCSIVALLQFSFQHEPDGGTDTCLCIIGRKLSLLSSALQTRKSRFECIVRCFLIFFSLSNFPFFFLALSLLFLLFWHTLFHFALELFQSKSCFSF